MANKNFLKLQFLSPGRTFYCYIPITFSDLISTIKNYFPKENAEALRKYWIDGDKDRIDICNQETYQIFQIKSMDMRIYLSNESQERINSAPTSPNQVIHHGVICDECKAYPIRGFRYRCAQCPNYNLCMKCEGKMKHNEHIMVRFVQEADTMLAPRVLRGGLHLTQNDKAQSRPLQHGHEEVLNYPMMHDVTGAGISVKQETASAPPADSNQNNKTDKKQEQKPRYSATAPSSSFGAPPCLFDAPGYPFAAPGFPFTSGAPIPPTLDPFINTPTIPIDCDCVKNGTQIINSFRQMFGIIPDPKVNSADAGSNKKDENKDSKDVKPETPMAEKFTQMPTDETNNSVNGNKTVRKAKAQKGSSSKNSGFPVAPVGYDWKVINARYKNKTRESEQGTASSSSSIGNVRTIEPSLKSDSANPDSEKPMQQPTDIGQSPAVATEPETVTSTVAQSTASSSLGNVIEPSSKLDSANSDFVRPMQEWLYIDMEQVAPNAPAIDLYAPISAVTPTSPVTPITRFTPGEALRYQIVYHKKKHINDAIFTMMSMGYTNERQWLTNLLDKVDGDIPKALELIKQAQ